jgi:UvrB/uvrC motif
MWTRVDADGGMVDTIMRSSCPRAACPTLPEPGSSMDLTSLLTSWHYEPGRINVRRITGEDGRQKVQVRIDLGILQMEAEGRPDGERPHGCESLLDHHAQQLQRYVEANGSPQGFVLSPDECRALREEALQYYHRYVATFALGDYAAVVRDTARNLRLFDLCNAYAAAEDDQATLEQFRAYVITMQTRAKAELALAAGRPKDALAAIDAGLMELRSLFDDPDAEASYETANEVQLLRGMRDALVPKLPTSQRVELQERLRAALDSENYELAAILRDELRMLDG